MRLADDVSSFFKAAERVIPTLRGVKHTSANFVSMQRSVDEHQGKFDIIGGTEDVSKQITCVKFSLVF